MKTVFEIALIALCLIIVICPLALPKEISGKNISGGCPCCSGIELQYCAGTLCWNGCSVCVNDNGTMGCQLLNPNCAYTPGCRTICQDYKCNRALRCR